MRSRCSARAGFEVEFPNAAVCCGQPAFNAGILRRAPGCALVSRAFSRVLPIVIPVGVVRDHGRSRVPAGARRLRAVRGLGAVGVSRCSRGRTPRRQRGPPSRVPRLVPHAARTRIADAPRRCSSAPGRARAAAAARSVLRLRRYVFCPAAGGVGRDGRRQARRRPRGADALVTRRSWLSDASARAGGAYRRDGAGRAPRDRARAGRGGGGVIGRSGRRLLRRAVARKLSQLRGESAQASLTRALSSGIVEDEVEGGAPPSNGWGCAVWRVPEGR